MTNASTPLLPAEPRPKGILYRLLRTVPPLRAAVRFAREHIARNYPQTWRLEGRERVGGASLAILFAGQLENKNYLAHLAFASAPNEQPLGRHWLWRLAPRRRALDRAGVDVQIVELHDIQHRWLGSRFQFFVPIWVGSVLDLERVVARLRRSKNAKKDLRRIRKEGLFHEVTCDPNAFEYFYANMYLPYTKNRFGDQAFTMSREEMLKKRDSCELSFVRDRSGRIAGNLIRYEGGGVHAWSMGIKDGDRAHLKAGAVKVLDYFSAPYLAARGFKALHLGGSRPFLRDGVLRHKRERGARVCDHTPRYFSLNLKSASPGAAAFAANNPFIYESDGEYRGALFVESDAPPTQDRLRALFAEYYIEGLAGLTLFDARSGGEKQLARISRESTEGEARGAGPE